MITSRMIVKREGDDMIQEKMLSVFFKAAIAISYGDIDDENSCYVEIKSVWCVIIIIGECVMVWVEIAHMIRVTV
ncbi:unnamed protein product [Rhizophagus irregularis]|nr:unnamed protein product [Rhizophagus irregularis]